MKSPVTSNTLEEVRGWLVALFAGAAALFSWLNLRLARAASDVHLDLTAEWNGDDLFPASRRTTQAAAPPT